MDYYLIIFLFIKQIDRLLYRLEDINRSVPLISNYHFIGNFEVNIKKRIKYFIIFLCYLNIHVLLIIFLINYYITNKN